MGDRSDHDRGDRGDRDDRDSASSDRPGSDPLDAARDRLLAAERADHEGRLEIVNEVHALLEGELDEQAPASGR